MSNSPGNEPAPPSGGSGGRRLQIVSWAVVGVLVVAFVVYQVVASSSDADPSISTGAGGQSGQPSAAAARARRPSSAARGMAPGSMAAGPSGAAGATGAGGPTVTAVPGAAGAAGAPGGPAGAGAPAGPAPKSELDKRLLAARDLLVKKDYLGAFRLTRELAEEHPDNGRALIYDALARVSIGDYTKAGDELDTALKVEGEHIEILVYGGLVATALQRPEVAADCWEKAVSKYPPMEKDYRPLIEKARASAEKAAPTPPP